MSSDSFIAKIDSLVVRGTGRMGLSPGTVLTSHTRTISPTDVGSTNLYTAERVVEVKIGCSKMINERYNHDRRFQEYVIRDMRCNLKRHIFSDVLKFLDEIRTAACTTGDWELLSKVDTFEKRILA